MAWCVEADTVLPSQYYEHALWWTAEQRLIAALLEEALRTACRRSIVTCRTGTDGERMKDRAQADAIAWLESPDDQPFTFVFVCQVLDLDPECVRRRLGITEQPRTRWYSGTKIRPPKLRRKKFAA